jgi:hypothetical protein
MTSSCSAISDQLEPVTHHLMRLSLMLGGGDSRKTVELACGGKIRVRIMSDQSDALEEFIRLPAQDFFWRMLYALTKAMCTSEVLKSDLSTRRQSEYLYGCEQQTMRLILDQSLTWSRNFGRHARRLGRMAPGVYHP